MKTSTRKGTSLPLMITELTMASWETITRRMLLISQNKCSQAEYQRMVGEKAQAVMATSMKMMSSNGLASMTSLMAPWLSLASANAKRLRKR